MISVIQVHVLIKLLYAVVVLGATDATVATEYIREDFRVCYLHWRPGGYGSIPPDAIHVGDGNETEYLGRVLLPNREWAMGRITIPDRSSGGGDGFLHIIRESTPAQAASGSTDVFYTYQILTNPDNCVVNWEVGHLNPVNAVPLSKPAGNSRYTSYAVGRIKFAGAWVGGLVDVDAATITFTYNGNTLQRTDIESDFEILTSVLPKMFLQLQDFEYDIDWTAVKANTSQVIIGETWIHSERPVLKTAVDHERSLTEKIRIHRALFLHCHVERAVVNLNLWYNEAEPIQGEFSIPSDGVDFISMSRSVNSVGERVEVRSEEGTETIHVSTTASVFKGSIPFQATALFRPSASSMSSGHISQLLGKCGLRTGRTSMMYNHESTTVMARVEGTLSGEFIIRTVTYVSKSLN